MLGEEFVGEIKSVTTKLKKNKNEDGSKSIIPLKKIVIKSSSITEESLAKTFPEIYNTITVGGSYTPIQTASFGDQKLGLIQLSIKPFDDEETGKEFEWYDYNRVDIKQFNIKNDEGIITYTFVVEFLTSVNDKYLDDFIGCPLEIKFNELIIE